MTNEPDFDPQPRGELALQVVALPIHTNRDGDIYGGWLVSQMDIAGAQCARLKARGRVATVAVDTMAFIKPVPVGSTVYCYTELLDVGRSSMRIRVEVWISEDNATRAKVTDSIFTFVAIDDNGRTRPVSAATQ